MDMTQDSALADSPSRARRLVFTGVATLIALMFSINLLSLLAPWTDANLDHVADPTTHRWHHALDGSLDILAAVVIVGLLLRPLARSLLAQFLAVAALLSAVLILPFVGPTYLIITGLLLLVPAAYPRPAALRRLRSDDGVSLPLLVVASAAAAALLPRAAQELNWQLTGFLGEQVTSTAWVSDAADLVVLTAAGLLTATRLPGWRLLALACAGVYAYLAVVAIAYPTQPGSWGVPGGIAAGVIAALFIAATFAHRSLTPEPPRAAPRAADGDEPAPATPTPDAHHA
jgi:hypothetical protein